MIGSRRPREASLCNAGLPHARATTELVLSLFIASVSLLLALDQLVVVQPELYLHTGVGPSKTALQAVLVGCGIAGWLGSARLTGTTAMLVASLGVALSGPAQFSAFSRGDRASLLATLPAMLGLLGAGGGIRKFPESLRSRIGADDLTRVLLHPLVALCLVSGLCAAAVFENTIGPIRASLAIAGGLAAAAAISTTTADPRVTKGGPRPRVFVRWLSTALLVAYAAGAYLAERRLPLRRLLTSSHPIVYFAESERCTLSVTSGQSAYHLFVDGELRFSTFDDRRWAEALVMPALSRVQAPRRALVLSTGEGLIERELLRDPRLQSITSVARCRLVSDTARQSGWLRHLTANSMNSSRVSRVERDPAAYLVDSNQQTYDLLIVDLPDPAGPLESKYYSRRFYQLLAARMSESSVLVVQATSARRSPRTYATIGATLKAAGLSLQPIMVPLISRGEWSLYLAAKGPIANPMREEWIQHGLAATMPAQFYHPWPDTLAPSDFVPEPSTLDNAKVREWFTRESEEEKLDDGASLAARTHDPNLEFP
jgi:predicted membrane-bound spermidine synthase